ncbi:MAG: response regulator [Planctomycetes bacterium]|nr:response regulator [Planctomycetota bacterium]
MTDVAANAPLVLVIEDEPPIRRFLRATLTANGFRVNEAGTAREGVMQAGMQPPDVIILDLGLPDADGLEVTRQIRGWSTVPIIVLSARGQEQDKVSALEQGADDYLTKPFSVGELIARIRVALRHGARIAGQDVNPVYQCARGGRTLRVDLARRRVQMTGAAAGGVDREVSLTPTEFKLLALLVRHAGRVLTHKQILTEVWGPVHADDVQYLRVYAGQLRQKLEADPAQPQFLVTEAGVGYRLAEAADSP